MVVICAEDEEDKLGETEAYAIGTDGGRKKMVVGRRTSSGSSGLFVWSCH